MLNWGLLKNPLNWLTVLLMVLIASIGLHFVTVHLKQLIPPTGDKS